MGFINLIDDNDWIISGNNIFPAVSGNVGINNSNLLYDLGVSGTFYANSYYGPTEPCTIFDGETYFFDNVGIGSYSMGTYKLYVNGSAYSTGGWTGSDKKIKKDVLTVL